MIILFVFSAFRSVTFIGDTSNYAIRYNLGEEYFYEYMSEGKGEPLYSYLNIICLRYGIPFQYIIIVFSLITSLFTLWAISRTSKKDIMWGLAIYILLTFYMYSYNASRQMLSASILLCGYTFLKENKYIIYIIMVIIATAFHGTSYIAIIVILLQYFRKLKIPTWLVIVFVAVSFIIGSLNLLIPYTSLVGKYGSSGLELTRSGFHINLLLYSIFFLYCYVETKEKEDLYLKIYFIGIILMNIFSYSVVTMRIAYMFTPIQILLFLRFLRLPQYKNLLIFVTAYCTIVYYYMAISASTALLAYEFCSLNDLGIQ